MPEVYIYQVALGREKVQPPSTNVNENDLSSLVAGDSGQKHSCLDELTPALQTLQPSQVLPASFQMPQRRAVLLMKLDVVYKVAYGTSVLKL